MEKLHGEVEKQLDLFLKNQKTGAEWRKFRETLIGLTDVTHSHFAKLVQVSLTLSTLACMVLLFSFPKRLFSETSSLPWKSKLRNVWGQ